MKTSDKISLDEIKFEQEEPLDLFYAGIRSPQTKATLYRMLKKFLLEACHDILDGDIKMRARQFVEIGRNDPKKATGIIIAYVNHLRKRTELEKTNPNYMNPSYLPNKIKPIKKLLEMNDVSLAWRRIRAYYPEPDNTQSGRGYTKEEIRLMLQYADEIDTEFIILASSSGGLRVGAWDDQKWENIFPIYRVGDHYKMELEPEDDGTIVCAGMKVYRGTKEEYVALISLEAWYKLQDYRHKWTGQMGRPPTGSDILILTTRGNKLTPLTPHLIRGRLENLLRRTGLRGPLPKNRRRFEVPATHGFRRYWDKIMMNAIRRSGTLSSLVIKERLFGHYGLVNTDRNYFWTDTLELVPTYLEAMPELMISKELQLMTRLEKKTKENEELIEANREKDKALYRLAELEAKVERMHRYDFTAR